MFWLAGDPGMMRWWEDDLWPVESWEDEGYAIFAVLEIFEGLSVHTLQGCCREWSCGVLFAKYVLTFSQPSAIGCLPVTIWWKLALTLGNHLFPLRSTHGRFRGIFEFLSSWREIRARVVRTMEAAIRSMAV